MLKNIFLITNIAIHSSVFAAESPQSNQASMVKIQDVLTGTVNGTGCINLCPESVRTFITAQLHKSDDTKSNTINATRHTASLNNTHIKTMLTNLTNLQDFCSFDSYTLNFGERDIDGSGNLIYKIVGTKKTNAAVERKNLSITVDNVGTTTATAQFIQGTQSITEPLPPSPTPSLAETSTNNSSAPEILAASTKPEKRTRSRLESFRKIFKRPPPPTSSSEGESNSQPSSSNSPRKESTPTPPQQQLLLNQELHKELTKRSSQQ